MGRTYQYTQKTKNGTFYVFECEDEYIPEKKQTRKKNRKLIGKLDENGNIIPTRKKAPPRRETDQGVAQKEAAIQRLEGMVGKQKKEIESLRSALDTEKADNKKLRTLIRKASSTLAEATVG